MSEHELWNELGNLYFMSGAYNQAVYAYHRSIQLDGSYGRPYSNLALAYVQQGKYSEAIDLYKRSIELLVDDDEKAISWNRLGNVYRHLKDYQRAVVAYQRADELNPERRGEREDLGQLLYSSVDEATAHEEPATDEADSPPQEEDAIIASNPDEERTPLSDEASASWVQADAAWYEQATSEVPDDSSSTWTETDFDDVSDSSSELEESDDVLFPKVEGDNLAEWLPIPEPIDGAEKQEIVTEPDELPEGEGILLFQESQPPAYTPLLTARSSDSGAAERSEKIFQPVEVDVEEPQPAPAAFVVAVTEEEPAAMQKIELDFQPAIESAEIESPEMIRLQVDIEKIKRVAQVNPRNGFAWDTLGTLYKSAGMYKDAIAAYQQAVSADPSKAFYYHHLGLAFAAEGRDEDAMTAFQRVVELNPDHSLAHATLAGYFKKLGLEELAQNHINKAMKNIFDSENEYNRACLEAIRGNADRAIELLRVALENKQTHVDWVLHDPDLDFIRNDSKFQRLIAEYNR